MSIQQFLWPRIRESPLLSEDEGTTVGKLIKIKRKTDLGLSFPIRVEKKKLRIEN
jgi:hypothetical protein